MSVLCKEGLERFWADAKTYFTGTATPLMDGTAAVGSSSKFAREDHVHPSYPIMTAAEMEAGTDTTGKLVTAKDLHDVYVNVTGDTMTGNLTIERVNPSISLKNTLLTAGTTPTESNYGTIVSFRDSNGTALGTVGGQYLSDDRLGAYLQGARSVNGTTIYNKLGLLIDASGNRTVTVTDASAWRTALDVYSTTESDNRFVNVTGDTMTGNLTMSSASINFSDGSNTSSISHASGYINVNGVGGVYLAENGTTKYTLDSSGTFTHTFSGSAYINGALNVENDVNITGSARIYGSELSLGTPSSSSNDSADIVFKYGNANEKARIWMDASPTSAIGPLYRVYDANGASLYNGRLATVGQLNALTSSASYTNISSKNCANNTDTSLGSVQLTAGTWILAIWGTFATNTTGRRAIYLSTSNTSYSLPNKYCEKSVGAAQSYKTFVTFTVMLTITATTTYYLRAYQNSGGALACDSSGIQRVRIK